MATFNPDTFLLTAKGIAWNLKSRIQNAATELCQGATEEAIMIADLWDLSLKIIEQPYLDMKMEVHQVTSEINQPFGHINALDMFKELCLHYDNNCKEIMELNLDDESNATPITIFVNNYIDILEELADFAEYWIAPNR